jgi:16S rRNA (guanine527-N7)-methyltransferase
VKHAWDPLGLDLSPEQVRALVDFERLLRDIALPRGMIARGDVTRIGPRHVADSLRAVPHVPSPARAYDLGSGAGLPGIPVAIALPDSTFELVEPNQRKGGFLELAVRELGLDNVKVRVCRAQDLDEPAEACLSRAFASLERAWELSRPLLRPGGRLIYFAGTGAESPPSLPGARAVDEFPADVLETAGALIIITAT